MHTRFAVLACILALIEACALPRSDPARRCAFDGPDDELLCTVSLVELISRPEIYDGRRVKVVGWLHLEFEGDALYLHREDYDRATMLNSLRFSAPKSFKDRSAEFNDSYCIVMGTFIAYDAGTSAIERGGIEAIAVTRLPATREAWNPDDQGFVAFPSWP
jgi:hypothetical protein